MNRNGIALAADSAVTSDGGKIYNSANKLFSLSNNDPIGIMVYGNDTFMGTPWEVIIKVYRELCKDKSYNNLQEYAESFLNFLENDNRFSSVNIEKLFLKEKLNLYLLEIFNKVNQYTDEEEKSNQLQVTLSTYLMTLERCEDIECLSGECEETFANLFYEDIKEVVGNYIDLNKVNDELWDNFIKVAYLLSTKKLFDFNSSGVVIAGYGNKEIFPSYYSYNLYGTINGKLIYGIESSSSIEAISTDTNSTQVIRPFAQNEVVHSFLTGIDPVLNDEIHSIIYSWLELFPKLVSESLHEDGYNEDIIVKVSDKILQLGIELNNEFKAAINNTLQQNYVFPLLDVIRILPKDELASMAKALVNLTSLKRKVSGEAETVGGPIDVAVVSKGDGFVWIDRKHYFEADKNYRYFNNIKSREN